MEVVNHIRDLLYHHDCVVVPGFGGFVTNERQARIDRSSGSFHPPGREVGFNGRLDHNDGLLVSHISARLSMNYVDSMKLVGSFTGQVKSRLLAGRTVQFDGIGRFIVDRNHNLQFDPDPAANFLTDAYGLSFFRYPEIYRDRQGRILPAGSEASLFRGGARKILRYAAITIPLIAALSWGAMNSGIREFSFDLTSLNPFSAVVNSQPGHAPGNRGLSHQAGSPVDAQGGEMTARGSEIMNGEAQDQPAEASAEDAGEAGGPGFAADSPVSGFVADSPHAAAREKEVAPPAASRSHYLVAGSFKRRTNALTLSQELEREGYDTRILESENGMYRVSMYSSGNRSESLRMLRQVRAEKNSSDIWMLSM
jgi:nucleoid DNA-binding protein